MIDNVWMEQKAVRASYRAVLREDVDEEQLGQIFAACQSEMEHAYKERILLTASLYRYERFLFLYTEGVGKRVVPEGMLASISPVLQRWPGVIEKAGFDRVWVYMQPYYYHAVPGHVEEWMRGRHPEMRRGRIALLAPDKWEEYMEHHMALMKEGLIEGDRYHLISIHENVLFSYFEEPKNMTNLQSGAGMQGSFDEQNNSEAQGSPVEQNNSVVQGSFDEQNNSIVQDVSDAKKKRSVQSIALEAWLRTDPESHFVRFASGQGPGPDQNFVFLPCCAGV